MKVEEQLKKRLADIQPDVPEASVVSQLMMDIVKQDKSATMTELGAKLRDVIGALHRLNNGIILASVGQLFFRHITLNSESYNTIDICRKEMLERGKGFLNRILSARPKIATSCNPFILDGSTILTHSHSRVVLEAFKLAAKSKKHFQVFVTESRPDCSGTKMKAILDAEGIPCTLILDAEVGSMMEKVDMVLVGAESVVESGGIINKAGSYQMAIIARELNKPFYVLAESFKFARLYPLNQEDLRQQLRNAETRTGNEEEEEEKVLKDYTPPSYITLLFTDLGILTPSAVSDELIKIYT